MEEIYLLIGRLIEKFQELEEILGDVLFLLSDIDFSKKVLDSKETFGQRFNKIKESKILEEEEDISVLDYIRKKRNYVAHEFFKEFNKSKKQEKVEELKILYKEVKVIEKGIIRMLLVESKKKWI